MSKSRSQLNKSIKFSLSIAVITFVLAAVFSVISSSLLSGVSWTIGIIILLVIVLIGVFFDSIGIASTAANETPFHAMAAEKVFGAKQAVRIIRNADRFSSFCNDVIGDISGIISGTASAIIIIQFANVLGHSEGSVGQIALNVILTSIVAAITVGGKALGKFLGIHYSTSIIIFVGKVIAFYESKFNLKAIKKKRQD